MRVVLFLVLFLSSVFGVDNISLARTLMSFNGDEYNILITPQKTVTIGKKKKTKAAIKKGYYRAKKELERQIKLRDIPFHMKTFKRSGTLKGTKYQQADKKAYKILLHMLEQQIDIREQLFDDAQDALNNTQAQATQQQTVDAEDIDVDIDDSAFDISDDKVTVDDGSGNALEISPEDAFINSFVELSELYNQEVVELYKAKHPFLIDGKPVMKPVNSVFGMAFFPTKYGSVKMMKIYVLICNIGTEEAQSVQVIAKEIPNFKWDRNYLYISAATGKVLRQIVAGVLGESLE